MPQSPPPQTARLVFFLLGAFLLAPSSAGAAAAAAAAADGFPPYANHTVGGAAGWAFDSRTGKPATNYTAWAESQAFYVGDFLLFYASADTTVIQTTNATTYALCSLDQDFGTLTSQLGADLADMTGSSSGAIPAQLTQPGDEFFFSHAAAGQQCRKGMRFRIKVRQGRGLPPPQPPPLQQGPEPRAAAAPPVRPQGGDERSGTAPAAVGSGAGAGCRRESVGVVILALCSIMALLAVT